MLFLAAVRGPLIIAFALAGLFVSVFYVAPPIRLKHHGLGEPGVFLVWGPLMVGGTFLAATGTIEPWVLLVSVPYALLVTSVLFGKHIDKIEADAELGVRTLPVILGEARRGSSAVADDPVLPADAAAVLAGWIGPWVLLVVLGPAPARRSGGSSAGRSRRVRRRVPSAAGRCGSSGFAFVHTPPGGRPADPRAAAERSPADPPAAALAVAGP